MTSFKAQESLSEQIAQHLARQIIHGDLLAGDRIQELRIAGELEVSRGSVREALRILEAQGFWDIFPPQDARVVSWTIAMGVGHVILLQIPAGSERRLNLALENGAWGAFNTEVYLTYDYKSVWEDYIERREEAKADRN